MVYDEFIKGLSKTLNLTQKDTKEVVGDVFSEIMIQVQSGEEVNIPGFGKFHISTIAAHQGINPQTKESISIPDIKTPKFKPSKYFRLSIRNS